MITITEAQATGAGLPAIGIQLDPGSSGFSGKNFSGPGNFLTLSGPPGGPAGLRLDITASEAHEAGLRAEAAKRYGAEATMGSAGTIRIAGQEHPALTLAEGVVPARAEHLLVLVSTPKGNILIDYWCSAGRGDPEKPSEWMDNEDQAALLGSLKISTNGE